MKIIESNCFDYNFENYGDKIVAFVINDEIRAENFSKIYKGFKLLKTEEDLINLENLNVISSQYLIEIWSRDIFDVLIIDLMSSKDFYHHIILQLFKYKKDSRKSLELVVYNHSNNYPFFVKNFQEKNCQSYRISEYRISCFFFLLCLQSDVK